MEAAIRRNGLLRPEHLARLAGDVEAALGDERAAAPAARTPAPAPAVISVAPPQGLAPFASADAAADAAALVLADDADRAARAGRAGAAASCRAHTVTGEAPGPAARARLDGGRGRGRGDAPDLGFPAGTAPIG